MPNAPRPPWESVEDGWSTPTRVQAGGYSGPAPNGSAARPAPPRQSHAERSRESAAPRYRETQAFGQLDSDRYPDAGREFSPYPEPRSTRTAQPYPPRSAAYQPRERGLPGWGAVLVLIAIAAVGAVIDNARGTTTGGGFNIGIVAASLVAILVVRRSGMFPIVIAPPIVYSLGSAFILYLRSGGLSDRHVLYDAASNWLVYGFPAIAAATAAVLIVCGFRLIIRR